MGLKTLAGQTQPLAMDSVCSLPEQTDRADKFYDFYCRFNRLDFTAELSQVLDRVRQNIYTYVNDTEVEEITQRLFRESYTSLTLGKLRGLITSAVGY